MPTIEAIIRRLLPEGTRRRNPKTVAAWPTDWETIPRWPPDVFAVAATLADRSACYAETFSAGGRDGQPSGFCLADKDHAGYLDFIKEASESWRANNTGKLAGHANSVDGYWSTLLKNSGAEVCRLGPAVAEDQEWQRAALLLMVIADQTCHGIGFPSSPQGNPLATFLMEEYQHLKKQQPTVLPFPDHTLCDLVPPGEVCVQPKTITVQVGCTLRSFSHHLALLPSIGEVETVWLVQRAETDQTASSGTAAPRSKPRAPLNLLVVPFPYHIGARGFVRAGSCAGFDGKNNKARFFDLKQDWLEPKDTFLSDFSAFLLRLIAAAQREVSAVHGLVLPELALNGELAEQVAAVLARETGLELFMTGVLTSPASGTASGEPPRNSVYACSMIDGKPFGWLQHKHHRWKLERNQIARYHLGDCLDLDHDWWERTDISRRKVAFRVVRNSASVAVLICEDLARVDPVQTVIRSVGPNLVVALLMDAAFHEKRWAYRYASVLAGDPGSSVLAVTSLGLIRRSFSFEPGAQDSRAIAMWSDSRGATKFLELPRGHHALLLTLSTERALSYTLDGRSDASQHDGQGTTIALSLSGVHAIKDMAASPPWLKID